MTDEQNKPQGGTVDGQGSSTQQEQPKPQPQTPPPPAANEDDDKHLRSEEAKRYRRELRQTQAAMEETTKTLKTLADELKAEKEARIAAEQAAAKAKADADRTALVSEIATAHGLTPVLAKRLQGNTKEELEADAKVLAAEFKASGGQRPSPSKTPAGLIGDQTPPSRAQQLMDIMRPQAGTTNPFKGGYVEDSGEATTIYQRKKEG